MTPSITRIWNEMVRTAKDNDCPAHSDIAIIAVDQELRSNMATIMLVHFKLDILETKLQKWLTGSEQKTFKHEELE